MKKKQTYLVTGGAGFIGSYLCERLIRENNKVICLDNLITGHMENVNRLKSFKDFKFVKHDISKHIVFKENIDFVLHFASPASPIDYLNFPIQTLKVGSLGTHNALGIAKAKKAKFLLASTSEIYGDPKEHPQKETYWGHVNTIGPRGVYDEAKRFAEAITMAYHRYHKLDTRIIRIFNTYGPRMRMQDGRAIPNFITQALKNKSITVYGKGTQTRSFCFVEDLVEAIFRLMQVDFHEPVNLGNPNERTILNLAKTIISLSKSKSKLIYNDLPVDDPKQRQPDITRAKRLFKWQPQVNLKSGLLTTISWFKEHI
ncbi:MAG: SDR family oxidoreductase [Candidatus Gygaella obscura]|nr:SDR family oxidoreductase [Candidatus Gygaella obscura]